jgi:hypothetical protein
MMAKRKALDEQLQTDKLYSMGAQLFFGLDPKIQKKDSMRACEKHLGEVFKERALHKKSYILEGFLTACQKLCRKAAEFHRSRLLGKGIIFFNSWPR